MADLFIGSLRCKEDECNAENSWRDRTKHTHTHRLHPDSHEDMSHTDTFKPAL